LACQSQERALRDALEALTEMEERSEETLTENGGEETNKTSKEHSIDREAARPSIFFEVFPSLFPA